MQSSVNVRFTDVQRAASRFGAHSFQNRRCVFADLWNVRYVAGFRRQ
jgi:hypothetical protein